MADNLPLACSLDAGGFQQRLGEIAAIGGASLIAAERQGDSHRLRFRADPETRRRLERVVAAEARCCPFLEIALAQRDEELVLSIAAPDAGRDVADGLAAAFGSPAAAG